MVTLLGKSLPNGKLVQYALTQFFGVGLATSGRILARVQIPARMRTQHLTESQLDELARLLQVPKTATLENVPCVSLVKRKTPSTSRPGHLANNGEPGYALEGGEAPDEASDVIRQLRVNEDRRRYENQRIQRKVDMMSYEGKRHQLGLPVHGQKTHTGGFTAKKLNRPVRFLREF